jgi:phosphoglycolate phosphatase
MPRPIVVFDLDGTLIDTAPDLLAALDVVLAEQGVARVPHDLGRQMIGHGAKAMIASALRFHGLQADEVRLESMHERFIDYYCDNIAEMSRPFPGAVAALDRLSEAGVGLAVCTNKLEALSRGLDDALELSPRLAGLVGPDTLGVRKPDPAHLLGTIGQAGGDRRRALMVGDSSLDVMAAKGAGIPALAVDFGYPEKPVDELGADIVLSHYDELWKVAASRLGLGEAEFEAEAHSLDAGSAATLYRRDRGD